MNWKQLLSNSRISGTDRIPDGRNEFESDVGRILFSPAIRRMHDKTQVFPLLTDDNTHSRLTHSLEVSSVGRGLGVKACEIERISAEANLDKSDLIRTIPSIITAACLVHDVGNPPFGHQGEKAFQDFVVERFGQYNVNGPLTEPEHNDYSNFDGNAQGLRVISKLLGRKVPDGLNLTYATLGAFLKYPCTSEEKLTFRRSTIEQKKIGVFASEKEVLYRMRENTGVGELRHPLVYLVEASDDITYLVVDLEDAFNKGLFSFEELRASIESEVDTVALPEAKLLFDRDRAGEPMPSLAFMQERMSKRMIERRNIINFRTDAIRILVDCAFEEFKNSLDSIMMGEYHDKDILTGEYRKKDILTGSRARSLESCLRNFCKRVVLRNREILRLESTGDRIIRGLLKSFMDEFDQVRDEDYYETKARLVPLISTSYLYHQWIFLNRPPWEWSNYERLQVVVDFVSGMTDRFALHLFQSLEGMRIGEEI